MIKKIVIFLLITTLMSCGYTPIYLKKNNFNLSIKEYELLGEKKINRQIVSLLNLKKDDKEKSQYTLKLNSQKILEDVAKDKTGKVTIYKLILNVDVELSENEKLIKEKNFIKSFIFKNSDNKFDLMQYQKNIENNLINKLSEEIIIFLNT
ncbi:hypothetical protein IDH10_03885 [Pelagibacterales bacterium SAG-MED20]|nr:hypothetical protein [Pelagibacterales bacterium SAG-MED20]